MVCFGWRDADDCRETSLLLQLELKQGLFFVRCPDSRHYIEVKHEPVCVLAQRTSAPAQMGVG